MVDKLSPQADMEPQDQAAGSQFERPQYLGSIRGQNMEVSIL